MFNGKKVVVVMPAYNAEKTLLKTYNEVIAQPFVDRVIVVDDASGDNTYEIARKLDRVTAYRKDRNSGYGGNQKMCYKIALEEGADIVIMVHPDYQYTPMLIPAMASMIGNGLYHCVLGSRILGGYALQGGMPLYKYVCNRFLTFAENLLIRQKLSEYHTGYRAFSKELLTTLNFDSNSDDFIFDNEMLVQIVWTGAVIAEVSCPTKYFEEASSICFSRSLRYGIGCLWVSLRYFLASHNLGHWKLLDRIPRNSLKKEW
ncbi:MAG: Undecaprenyl-phosphate mannosyltransferase [Lentisphaerae bacterium ADurb.Bin242]|nr:MAG: Undecaprenyl-phosphate mannosyltransferase [Lentisphaerae bacterium ADurb.Bin242]